MVSFLTEALYPSIPLKECTKIIKEKNRLEKITRLTTNDKEE